MIYKQMSLITTLFLKNVFFSLYLETLLILVDYMKLFWFVDPDIDLGNAVLLKIKKLQRRISWSCSIFKRKKKF